MIASRVKTGSLHNPQVGKDLAKSLISNPRVEREDTSYKFEHKAFLDLLSNKTPLSMEGTVSETVKELSKCRDVFSSYVDRFLK